MTDSISLNATPSADRQRGSIVVIAMITVAGVGTIAASMVTALTQNGISNTEEIRSIEGAGVTDSMRLAVDEELDEDAVRNALTGNDLYKNGAATVEWFTNPANGTGGYVGFVGGGADRYGYRFITTGFDTNAIDFKPGASLDGCSTDPSTGTTSCQWNNGNEPSVNEPYLFSSQTEITINPNTDVEFDGLLVFDGDVNIELKNPSQPYREIEAEAVIVTGDFRTTFTVQTDEAFSGCSSQSVSNAAFGNGEVDFDRLAVGGTLDAGSPGNFSYTDSLDCETTVEANGEEFNVNLSEIDFSPKLWSFAR